MPPKRESKGKVVATSSRPKQRARRNPNAHGILFEEPDHHERYAILAQRRLIPTRYMCDATLDELGLKEEVHRMFHNIGMLEFMQFEAPTFVRITLEFFSTVEFKMRRKWTGSEMEFYGKLTFRLFDEDHELSMEELGGILRLPVSGPEAPPDTFSAVDFWMAITGKNGYNPSSGKASGIHNPCFRYAQKGLAYTLFGLGDSTGVAAKRELFFLHCMANNARVNATAFAANHLKQVGYASTCEISVGGMITQIADHFGYGRLLMEEPAVAGKTKIDMNTLVNQQMIVIMPKYYSLVIHNVEVLALPAPDSISIANVANGVYAASAPSVGDNVQNDLDFSGDEMEENDRPKEKFVPPPQDSNRQGEGSSSMS
ncbi:uncharacterized protein LOC127100949 isoform X2 [Lathyrus oleraceus]|uniref:Arabidopsis retrotransposon Orf1 C-terminal domain-containing protein n=1 Tax=Pisum sativum TaxID=3888 RepID=A0A9D4ZY29_PEA|nr:uncharacterized protein LOC127100949 isoform X2 [Pisum sativum]XP_050894222.1 uncharacterized protein LOC127100949 isoform X2 [Pisum sativum]KAI5388149.1 hypothetical protein KIW84_074009 [Pisum sativum]